MQDDVLFILSLKFVEKIKGLNFECTRSQAEKSKCGIEKTENINENKGGDAKIHNFASPPLNLNPSLPLAF